MILQPSPGWQMSTPLCAQGPQFRLQHAPQPLQRTPSCVHWPVPVVETFPHTPWVAPAAFVQRAPQQSMSWTQTSPGWMQKDELSEQVPFVQRPEQQPAEVVQGLPAVRQVVLSGLHLPLAQVPLQQDAELVQVALSAVQLVAVLQRPLAASHWRLQQSVFAVQWLPVARQVVTFEAQVPEIESHVSEQHCSSVEQATPTTPQERKPPPAPPV